MQAAAAGGWVAAYTACLRARLQSRPAWLHRRPHDRRFFRHLDGMEAPPADIGAALVYMNALAVAAATQRPSEGGQGQGGGDVGLDVLDGLFSWQLVRWVGFLGGGDGVPRVCVGGLSALGVR